MSILRYSGGVVDELVDRNTLRRSPTFPYTVISIEKIGIQNKQERFSSFTLRKKLKERNHTFIAVLHFTVTVGYLIISRNHILSNEPI